MRKRVALMLTFLFLGTTAALEAQAPGCEFCGDHPYYQEHAHGSEYHSEFTNDQSHGGGWYPYYCGVDHDTCQDNLMAAVEEVEILAEGEDVTAEQVETLVRTVKDQGIVVTLADRALQLESPCVEQAEAPRIAVSPQFRRELSRALAAEE